jgi:hypothetical protein
MSFRWAAERTGARPRTPEWDAGAVLAAVADEVGECNQIISRLSSGYARPSPGRTCSPAGCSSSAG